jgi:hypothetical protein
MPTKSNAAHCVHAACALLAVMTTIPAMAQDALERELREQVRLHNQRYEQGAVKSIATLEGRQIIYTRALRTEAVALAPQVLADFDKEMRPQVMRDSCGQLKLMNAQGAGISVKYVYNNLKGVNLMTLVIDDAACAAR